MTGVETSRGGPDWLAVGVKHSATEVVGPSALTVVVGPGRTVGAFARGRVGRGETTPACRGGSTRALPKGGRRATGGGRRRPRGTSSTGSTSTP